MAACSGVFLLKLRQNSPGASNYFHTYLLLQQSEENELIICNMIISVCVLGYKLMARVFYGELREPERLVLLP